MNLLIKSNIAGDFTGHYRLGQFWPRDGRVVMQEDFSPDEWAVLKADTRLHISPAPDQAKAEEEAKSQSLKDLIKAEIAKLDPADFEADGQPKLGALKERLPDQAKKVTGKLVAEVWTELHPTT